MALDSKQLHARRRTRGRAALKAIAGKNPGRQRVRLSVFRSSQHIYAQIIDDLAGKTLAAASSLEKDARGETGANVAAAKAVGARLAERAKAAGISQVAFDRSGYKYHGRVQALAEGAREGGLDF